MNLKRATTTQRAHAHAKRRLGGPRKTILVVTVLSMCSLLSTFGVSPAGAVDGVSVTPNFELEATVPLDTGTTTDPNAVNSATVSGDDWENVYNKSTGSGTADSANASRFLTDGINSEASEKLFTGGQSKDPENITSWRWTSGAGVQDKNDIEHAYAARYNATASNPAYLFFGLDRFSTDGTATLGFWFLKGATAPVTVNGVNKFSGTGHQNNDLLVQINYSNGGTVPTVAVSKWCATVSAADHCSSLGLINLATSNSQLCGASTTAAYCASTNRKSESSPWVFTLKGVAGDSDFAERTFFEGGVNLAEFGLDRDCFSTFVAETRSSNPFTSTLSDFVMGDFASCTASMTTTPSANETTNVVSPGTSVTDTATITGSGAVNSPFPSSSATAPGKGNKVNFYLCGPIASPATCSSTSNLISSNDLSPTSTAGVSSATSDAVNTGSSPLQPGRYCWHATWDGDENYPAITGESNATAECFVVRTIPTTTVTQPQDGSGAALSGAQLIGSTIYDHARVTAGGAGGGAIGGNVAFFICNPNQVSGGVCPDGVGTAAGNPAVTPVASSNPPAATADSDGVIVTQIGTWCFRATFTPTGSTYTGSSDGSAGECFAVRDTTTATSAQNWLPNDSATITAGSSGTTVAGTISIALYESADCGVAAGDTPVTGQTYTSGPLSGTGSISYSTNNTTYKVLVSKSVSWKVTFTSSNTLVGNSTHCESTGLTITN